MILETRAVAPFFKNGYLIGCETTRDAVLVDPGDEVEQLLDGARRHALLVRYILLTHAHLDHITGVATAKAALNVPVGLHQADNFLYEAVVEQGRAFGIPVAPQPPVDFFYTPGMEIPFGRYMVKVEHTPGHCPGGVCLTVSDAVSGPSLFVGDTLFAGSIGRTDLPGGDYATLMDAITRVLLPFGDDARVHPGHGPSTTIGQERRTNPFLAR